MKKIMLLLLPIVFLAAGCQQKNTSQSTAESTVAQSSSSSEKETDSTSANKSSNTEESSSKTETQTTTSSAVQSSAQTTSSSETSAPSSESSNTQSSEPANNTTNLLSNYSDLQIEYARVWLAVMGTQYKQWLADPSTGFELHVTKSPAGTPVDPYDPGSVVFPAETVTLSGGVTFQGLVVYSSNHNGTITQYNVPSHWQHDETSDHPELVKEKTQKILDEASVVSIPTGNPEDVKQLIDVMRIDN
jgi:DNA mismatch repair ATPase MutL